MTKWAFDEKVANNFDYIADTSIPKYRVIIHRTVNILDPLPRNLKIIDVGCATGNTLDVLKRKGFINIWGVDSSQAMIDETCKKGHSNLFCSKTFPIELSPFDVIIANWTLHFIPPKERINYIVDIYDSLNFGGVFILSEKIDGCQSEYLEFKRSNFLTDKEIKEKSEALRDVLITKPIEWYTTILHSMFRSVEIIDHTYCFVTLLVRK